ncbi:survival of motor neuron protein-interacting protein 1 [Aphelenchoides avenae]|nr:survival of motor neuron protein-interacting protein 1 [Aphelenchus avenae]
MQQDKIFDVGDFDRDEVNMDRTPTTVEEYMRQVVVGRERCPQVVTATIAPEALNRRQNGASTSNAYFAQDDADPLQCPWAPGKEWQVDKSNYFSLKRSQIESAAPGVKKVRNVKFPQVSDSQGWCRFCFESRAKFAMGYADGTFAYHKGTPPTTGLVLTLSDNQVNNLLQYQIEYFLEHGYSRAVFEWLFALLLVVKKPLLHEVCSALRDLCRQCRVLRATLAEEDTELIYEYSTFIAIISLYFGQRDLAD